MPQFKSPSLLSSLKEATKWQCFSFIFTVILVYAIARTIYLLKFHPASKFPGPKFAAISNVPYAYHWISGRWPWAVENMLKQYGKVVRVAPNELAFITPQAKVGEYPLGIILIRSLRYHLTNNVYGDILSSTQNGYETFLKTDLMDFGAGDRGFIWESDPVKRKEVAKRLLPAFAPKATKAKEPTLHYYIDLFIERMREIGSKGDGIEITKGNVSADLAYNRKLNHMRDQRSSEFLDTLLGTSLYGTLSQVSKKLPVVNIFALFFVSPSVLRSLPGVYKMNSEALQRRIDIRGTTPHPDFVDYMLPADAAPPATKKEKIHLEQVALQLFVAGFDPIQITLNAVFFFLAKDRKAYEILVREIRDAFQAYDIINADALVELKYLHAVISETMRVHISNGTGMPRISPGAVVDGVYIPKGIVCQMSSFAAARSPDYFRDPLEFRPERWLPAHHPEYNPRYANDQIKNLHPFGVGPRMCTGREIAWQQIKLFLAKVLWTFDLEAVKGMESSFDDDFRLHAMWKRPQLWIRFHHAGDGTFWREELFQDELDNMINHLDLRPRGFYLLGHSWGGMLGAAFASRQPSGLQKLVLASALASKELGFRGTMLLREQMPKDIREGLEEAESAGDYNSDGYRLALSYYQKNHVCRTTPIPPELGSAYKNLQEDSTANRTINGHSALTPGGSNKDWTVIPRLPKINVPTLIYDGDHDTSHEIAQVPFLNSFPEFAGSHFLIVDTGAMSKGVGCETEF
ncbi:cytochrome P450 [Xylaria venustula]|nr:cytochrome P450 [Xylaria venustula]